MTAIEPPLKFKNNKKRIIYTYDIECIRDPSNGKQIPFACGICTEMFPVTYENKYLEFKGFDCI